MGKISRGEEVRNWATIAASVTVVVGALATVAILTSEHFAKDDDMDEARNKLAFLECKLFQFEDTVDKIITADIKYGSYLNSKIYNLARHIGELRLVLPEGEEVPKNININTQWGEMIALRESARLAAKNFDESRCEDDKGE